MALSAIALCSRALLKIGAATIASFEEGSAEAEVAANLYPSIRDALLSAHPWNFATGQISLPQLVTAPVADYAYAYQLPADFLRALSAGIGGRGFGVSYRIAENRLHADVDNLVLTYVFRPEEVSFPPFFDQSLIARLAAEFCIPLTESTTRAEMLFRLAEDEFRRAKLADGQQDTPQALTDFPLVEVRS
ncbi:hypothetical protein [Magnetospirillum aberrantis]|uniref:Uncharacterized protein n=1 Tax=Magnetospirillum aberrantis SpK TaxID=908842 RepID=A0A7C9QW75_9PROT|nr:hypothetical protein [Magnetospirillum aberrantis]NFV80796.1 hypothetical protein [Magnetospirillum aberrantis SpK]